MLFTSDEGEDQKCIGRHILQAKNTLVQFTTFTPILTGIKYKNRSGSSRITVLLQAFSLVSQKVYFITKLQHC